jgi:ribosomal protein S18 acetylase RimI-like enzyme
MGDSDDLRYAWRGGLTDGELSDLTRSHGGRPEAGWWGRIRPHSLGWATARDVENRLLGFANVAWDGGVHAFLLDPEVRPEYQRRGVGTALVRLATERSQAAGCEWLHVDFEDTDRLAGFYFQSCGFRSTTAGLINLTEYQSRALSR